MQTVKKFVSSAMGKAIIITIVGLLVLSVFIIKTAQEEKLVTAQYASIQDSVQKTGQDETLPTFVEFSSKQCVYCKEVSQILHELKEEFEGRLNFVEMDINVNPHLASQYGQDSTPSYVIVDTDGELISQEVGAHTHEYIEDYIMDSLEMMK